VKLSEAAEKNLKTPVQVTFVCLFGWGSTALSAQIGYIAP